jgi:hypothetical protein
VEQSRRRLQDSELSWKFDYSVLTGAHRPWDRPLPGHIGDAIADGVITSACTDAMASNTGAADPCDYSCTELAAYYYPEEPAVSVRCFVYDRDIGAWPDSLMSMRRDRLDWHTWLEPTAIPAGEHASFTVGEGPECVNVTVQTVPQFAGEGGSSTSETVVETRCLLPGRHEHDHIDSDSHTVEVVGFTVEVVGYTNETFHSELGGTTDFIVGDCTDTLFRVHTTSSALDFHVASGTKSRSVRAPQLYVRQQFYAFAYRRRLGWGGGGRVLRARQDHCHPTRRVLDYSRHRTQRRMLPYPYARCLASGQFEPIRKPRYAMSTR